MSDIEMLTNSKSESIVLNDLLTSVKNQDFKQFQDILNNVGEICLDYYFEDPVYGTLLDKCCRESGFDLYVDLLLSRGANPNIVNRIRKKAPIHLAVCNSDVKTLKCLLNYSKTDVNLIDSSGSSALHYAVKLPDLEILELLLQCDEIDLNIVNKKGISPIKTALKEIIPNEKCIIALLNHGKLNLNFDPAIKEDLNKLLPDWEKYIKSDSEASDEISFSHTFSLLYNGKYDEFVSIIHKKKDDSSFLEGNNGTHTFLQYCCEFGIPSVVNKLLQVKVNPNNSTNKTRKTPIMIAAYKGYTEIVQMLIDSKQCAFSPIEGETVLHCAVRGSSESIDFIESERDHLQCLTILLADARAIPDINCGDYKGNTALHYATKLGKNEMVLLLLKAGASLSCFNFLNEPAFADINYKTLKKYLDSCIYTNDKLPREEGYEIILNYRGLKPQSNNKFSDSQNNPAESSYDIEGSSINYTYNTFESKSLLYMAQHNELKHLLKHPIFTCFLYLKWYRIRKGFYSNIIFYFIFLLSLTHYILYVYPNIVENVKSSFETNVYCCILSFLVLILALRECAQFVISPLKYLVSLENWLEIGIITTCVIILWSAEITSFDNKIRFSVICIMFSWGEFILLIGRHPNCSTYIEILKTVSFNFLKFLGWYSVLIFAFSLSFYILFGMDGCSFPNNDKNECALKKNETNDEDFFSSVQLSLFKTVIMLTGEFDASSVPFVTHPGISHALFIAFLFFIAIVLFNLLNGLAVSDTQTILSDSELVGYISRVKLIAFVETLVCNPLPNKGSVFDFSSCFESSQITHFKNKMISKYINLFQDGCLLNKCEVKILPFYGNQVQMGNSEYNCVNNRKNEDINANCYKKCGLMEMDSKVIHSLNEVLLEKHVEEELLAVEKKKEENERLFLEMIKNCSENINLVKQTVSENRDMLNKLAKTVKVGWNI